MKYSSVKNALDALERSKIHVPKDWDYLANDEDVMIQVMELEYMEKPLSAHLGVDKDVFPPLSQLEDDEVKIIVDKILEVWAVYNYFADLPERLPIRIAYETLLSVWDDVVCCVPEGRFHFLFYERNLEQYVDHKIHQENSDVPF